MNCSATGDSQKVVMYNFWVNDDGSLGLLLHKVG